LPFFPLPICRHQTASRPKDGPGDGRSISWPFDPPLRFLALFAESTRFLPEGTARPEEIPFGLRNEGRVDRRKNCWVKSFGFATSGIESTRWRDLTQTVLNACFSRVPR
jgi:hypothetical protein